jgi:ABC-type bacteriocin/lantibiotic exporter with double-glycine peptidase domain
MTIFVTFLTILLLYRERIIYIVQDLSEYLEFIGKAEYVINEFSNMVGEDIKFDFEKYKPVELKFETITFENVYFKYKSGTDYIMEDLNVQLSTKNKIVGITGLSGKGKSTFSKLLLKLYKNESGNIYIDDVNIADVDTTYIRKNIVYVNQNSKLFDKKVIENILYGCNDAEKCNAHLEEIMKYPKIQQLYQKVDFDKMSGAAGENLSGGQRQIINVIGGLINPSKILILDEPTNALDPELKKELLGLLKDFKKYKNCIMIISHDKEVFELFDEQLKL